VQYLVFGFKQKVQILTAFRKQKRLWFP